MAKTASAKPLLYPVAHFDDLGQQSKYAFVGLMLDWIKHDMKGDPREIIDRLDRVIHGSVAAALDRFRVDKPASNPGV